MTFTFQTMSFWWSYIDTSCPPHVGTSCSIPNCGPNAMVSDMSIVLIPGVWHWARQEWSHGMKIVECFFHDYSSCARAGYLAKYSTSLTFFQRLCCSLVAFQAKLSKTVEHQLPTLSSPSTRDPSPEILERPGLLWVPVSHFRDGGLRETPTPMHLFNRNHINMISSEWSLEHEPQTGYSGTSKQRSAEMHLKQILTTTCNNTHRKPKINWGQHQFLVTSIFIWNMLKYKFDMTTSFHSLGWHP